MCIQVILNFHNCFGFRPTFNDFLLEATIIAFGSLRINSNQSPACQWLKSRKNRSHSISDVFGVELFLFAFFHRKRLNFFAQQLKRQLVQTNDRTFFIIWQVINIQDIFHFRQVFARYLPDAPLLLFVRFERVFFRMRLTSICEIDSI